MTSEDLQLMHKIMESLSCLEVELRKRGMKEESDQFAIYVRLLFHFIQRLDDQEAIAE